MSSTLSNRIGVVASALTADLQQAPRQARLAGFGGLLLDVWSSRVSLPDLSLTGRRELLKFLSSQEQSLIGLQMELGGKGLGPGADVDMQIDRLERAMDCAVGLGSPLLCVEIGPLPDAPVLPKPVASLKPEQAGLIIIPAPKSEPVKPALAAAPDPAFVSQLNAALEEVGRRADRYSCVVAFSSALAGFASLSDALTKAACPWFGVDLDPAAVLQDAWDLDEIFSQLGSHIRHVRARDAVVGTDHRIRPTVIGSGNTDWPRLLSSLEQADYRGFITLDPRDLRDRMAAAVDGAAFLRRTAH